MNTVIRGSLKKSSKFFRISTFKRRTGKSAESDQPTRLPVELLRLVFELLPRGTKLYPLLFVNSAFYVEVKRILYRDIDLEGDTLRFGLRRRKQLFLLLSTKPALAAQVQTFAIPPLIRIQGYASLYEQYIYWRDLNRALQATTNLRFLSVAKFFTLYQSYVPFSVNVNSLLAQCAFKLRRMEVRDVKEGLRLRDVQLMTVQDELRELSIPRQLDNIFGSGTHESGDGEIVRYFPHLQILAINSPLDTIPRLLNGRSIKALDWQSSNPSLEGDETFPSVVSLRISVLAIDKLSRIATIFPSLAYLCIDFPLAEADQIPALIPFFRDFRSLKRVAFGGDGPSMWADNSMHRDELVTKLFWEIGSLEYAYLGHEELRVSGPSNATIMFKEWFIRGGTRVFERSNQEDEDRWKNDISSG